MANLVIFQYTTGFRRCRCQVINHIHPITYIDACHW